MALLVSAYVAGLLLPGDAPRPLLDGWLAGLIKLALVGVCWASAARTSFRRPELLLTAAGVTLVGISDTYLLLVPADVRPVAFPAPNNVGYLGFYVLMLSVLVILLRRQIRTTTWSVVLDSTIGVLGASSALVVLLTPVLLSIDENGTGLSLAPGMGNPLFTLLLVAGIAGIAISQGPVDKRRWILFVLGLVIFASTNIVYALIGTGYVVGTPLDAGWAVGLALIATWTDAAANPETASPHYVNGTAALALPAISTAAGLGVLILASQVPIPAFAVGLAATTMALAAIPLVSRQVALRRQARTDDLTGLPNRRALYAGVSLRLSTDRSQRRALLLLDLDRFKEVNDSLGHDAGDRLLVQVGDRLLSVLRTGDLLARVGGDEFAILLDHSGQVEAESVAAKLRNVLAAPFTLEGIALQISVSIGIALYPEQGDDLTALLRKADMAMYKAKSNNSGHHVYRSVDNSHGETRLRTLQELRVALENDQLVLHFQPKIDLSAGIVHSVEALVRWNHPTRGLLFPDQFLALVEEANLMHGLTQEVLRKALDQAQDWASQGRPLTVAVNLSASSLVDADLPERVGAMLKARDLTASALILEITEDFLMADRDRARDILVRLRGSGIRISVDDFGTGYSSLAYLRDLPIDELKLDQSFVFPMAEDPRAAALVASTIDLAHGLGLRMVAEGVENATTYDELVRYGCDYAQGYFMCRPVPAAQLDLWIAARTGDPARSL
ncbi:EAL domain-containing protein [Cryobacterium sp. TMT2-10]|uniref:EAL domain-containing protein n=1 Tax=Cryobacterium shii TaxID=1259235 RepID=A0AAQ2HHC5_9MICO|nr:MULTISPECIES: EAL domain-containing protein [Cryobacterium]TFC52898.1 EAL domain-containing protein [Cryobacterium shii]TFC81075.1 EAL domain-containing protein [Cryobacterium sp. TmT2-59]TFD19628.1 EAL domain-containing protein [Cryobacterium sp. TMT4-10]TFD25051.1 EAL domain-containing protein [Cryobacterium sp. TMT2-23]TFD40436.1 EAL domain-containing protein [Cryobacterium sp. TMT2-10]